MSGIQSKITRHEKRQEVKTDRQGGNDSTEGNPEEAEAMELTVAVGNTLHMSRKAEECMVRGMKSVKRVTNGT